MLQAKAFTIVELLIVIFIISLVASLVAPVSYRAYDKFKAIISESNLKKRQSEAFYASFVKDEKCFLNGTLIVCGNNTYKDLRDVSSP